MDIKDKVQSAMVQAEADAVNYVMNAGNGYRVTSMRDLRPDDIKDFTAGTSGTSKTMGENDTTVATGTTENTLSTDILNNESYVIEGLYLPAVTGVTTTYVSMFIGDAKQRWVRGARVTAEPNSTLYFDTPLVVKPSETIKVKFLTSAASATHPIEILGKKVKGQA
ncbi:hypothetical protein KKF61_08205 [Patescibacteria group bacterium]|nr:hypothetical protein [Patescibacteria group bacterium]